MTGPSGNRLSICPLKFRIAPRVPIDLETLGEAILNLSEQIDLPITLETSHYLFNIKHFALTMEINHWEANISVKVVNGHNN